MKQEIKTEAIRNAYGEALVNLGSSNTDIVVLDADVSSSTKSINFAKAFPDRFFNFGIAEANMVSAAAGMAAMGKIPFVNTFSFLICERSLDQLRACSAYNKLNVKFAANYGGMSDSFDGASHHSISDMAIIRSIPGMTLVVLSDSEQTRQAVKAVAEYEGPVYLRLCRAETPVFHTKEDDFVIGKAQALRNGKDVSIVATGIMVYRALEAAEMLMTEGIDASVLEVHTIKPLDEAAILQAARQTGAMVVCEEHNMIGGLGGAVAEALAHNFPIPVEFVGVADCYGESGEYLALLEKYGMSTDAITGSVKAAIKRKDNMER